MPKQSTFTSEALISSLEQERLRGSFDAAVKRILDAYAAAREKVALELYLEGCGPQRVVHTDQLLVEDFCDRDGWLRARVKVAFAEGGAAIAIERFPTGVQRILGGAGK